jgi:hypothetical protein
MARHGGCRDWSVGEKREALFSSGSSIEEVQWRCLGQDLAVCEKRGSV